jgi:hypothetical protein
MKIRRVGAQFLYADGQTDMAKLIVTSRNSAEASKNSKTTGRRNSEKVFGYVIDFSVCNA